MSRGTDLDEYLALVRAFPLAHIRDDAHLDAAVAIIDRLLDKGDRSPAEEMYLDALTDLVETYEEAHVPIPARSGVDALRFLMEANDLRQVDLVVSDETARTNQYLALLCGALTRDAGWDEDQVKVLAITVRERVAYDYGVVTEHVAALLLTGYHGLGDASDRA
jgi:antitoxin component HigA of HigAB toxin-antitoxin module